MVSAAALSLAALAFGAFSAGSDAASRCAPTTADSLGPFYEPGAPVRSRVERVTSCWGRATLIAPLTGGYRFESNRPPAYGGRPPHIHARVSSRGFRTLVTQHYPRTGRNTAAFDLVLRRA